MTFRRLLGFLAPYRRQVIASILLAIGSQLAALTLPYLTGRAIDIVHGRGGSRSALYTVAGLIVLAGLVQAVLMLFRRWIAGRLSLAVEYDLRNAMYRHLQRLSFGFFDRHQTGQLMSRATVDLQSVRFFLGYGLIFFSQNLITVLVALVALLLINWPIALIALAVSPLLAVAAYRYSRRSHPILKDVQQRIADVTTQAEENIVGVRVVKSFAQERRQSARFAAGADRVFERAIDAAWLQARYVPLLSQLPSVAMAAVLLLGGYDVVHGSLSLGDFFAINGYLLLMVTPLRSIGMWVGQYQRAMASGERIFEVLDVDREIVQPPGAIDLPDGPGRVAMRGVSFAYESGRPVLSEIDLEVEPGSTVALIGPTGCGKTTLTTLIPRFYDVSEGAVLVDGHDVRSLTLASLRAQVGIVSQDTFLFSTTVAENIAFGVAGASPEEIVQAARQAQAHEFICDLPDGYETRVGERGLSLSGGQRQRIAIARALLMNPRVLILDDATASVDATTEARIKLALREVMRGRTTLIIAHRLSTISMAERVVVLDHGRIVASGSPDELLETSPVYREIHEHGLVDRTFVQLDPDGAPIEKDQPEPARRAAGGGRLPVRAHTPGSHLAPRPERAADLGVRRTLRRVSSLIRYTWPYRGRAAGAIVALLLATAATIAAPLTVREAIDLGIDHAPPRFSVVVIWVLAFLAVSIAGWLLGSVQSYLTSWVGKRVLADLRTDTFDHLQTLELGYFERTKAGVVISRLTNDIEALNSLVTDGPTTLVQNTLTLIGSAVVLVVIDWRLALATLTVFPGMAIATVVFRSYSGRAYRRTRERLAEVTARLQEDISGVRVVQAFRREDANYERFAGVNGWYRQANVQTVNAAALYFPIVGLLSSAAMAVVLGYGGVLVFDGRLTAGDLFVFIGLLANFFDPVQQLSQFYQTFLSGTAALDKIFDVLDTRPQMSDRPGATDLPEIRGDVVLDDVRFAYRADTPEVLHGVSLTARAGQTVALVGHTGAGKSTIIKLLARFYDPTAGRILIDGHDLRDVTVESLRRQLGIVPQEGFLFSGSVHENIAFGRPQATLDEVVAAATAVGADGFIRELPDGYDTQIQERGSRLSVGQRQLVAFARALLADPRVLILDEATSSVDIPTEARIERALAELLAGRTAFVVAHRLSTIRAADLIVVLEHGQVIEAGTHEQLLARRGRDFALYDDWVEAVA